MQTVRGIQRVLPILAPPDADLMDMYRISRRKLSNFEALNQGCNECIIPGDQLDDEDAVTKYKMCSIKEIDSLVDQTVAAIVGGSKEAVELKHKCKSLSLHPVPVGDRSSYIPEWV
jgi:hypothetical protein